MSITIASNISSLVAQHNLSNTESALSTTFQQLSSGLRINTAADDAAGLGMAKSLNAQVSSYSVAERNANDGISMAQTADGAANQIDNLLTTMRSLAVEGSNGTLSANDQTNLNTEFTGLISEIDRVASDTKFNGIALLSGASSTVTYQVGINNVAAADRIQVVYGGADSSSLGVGALTVSSQANSQSAIATIDTAIQNLGTVREGFGSGINRLTDAVTNAQTTSTNLSSALSQIQDVDIAQATAAMAQQQVLQQAGASVLSQANQAPQLALQLLH
jgi:flagellin